MEIILDLTVVGLSLAVITKSVEILLSIKSHLKKDVILTDTGSAKKEVNKIFDLSEQDYNHLMQFSRKVAVAVQKAIPCKRVGMSIIGLEVPHVHVHLIPLNTMQDATFQKKVNPTPDEFAATATKIQEYF